MEVTWYGRTCIRLRGKDAVVVADPYQAVVIRYTADGALDTSFGTNGFVNTQLNQPFALLSDMAVQPDNKLLLYWSL